MPKLEKDRPMPALKTIQTKSDDLTQALEKMLEEARNMNFEGEKTFEITVREVASADEDTAKFVTVEQQRLLDMVDNVTPVKVDFDVDGFISNERRVIDGRDFKDKK